ncbi:flagellar hook-basal body complex protein FliE [Paracoccus litorisediminis]|uniref:flagellar hook-basal body complex protein FliE n=1 Tax=Paracoccus litorisediminis TaxID=2006130 RepID=UPI003730D34A
MTTGLNSPSAYGLMSPGFGKAAGAYRSAAQVPVLPGSGGLADGVPPAGPSFLEMVEQTAKNTIETVRAGDRAAVAGLRGEMPVQQVVEATMAMETALNVTVSVRDKMVEAYQEILRMAV